MLSAWLRKAGMALGVLPPLPGASLRRCWPAVLLNCVTVALAVSTYHSMCGNGAALLEQPLPPLGAGGNGTRLVGAGLYAGRGIRVTVW